MTLDADELRWLYVDLEMSLAEVASATHRGVKTVREALLEHGIALRGRGGVAGRRKTYPVELVARVRELYVERGRTQVEVAALLGTTAKVVQRLMAYHDIPARPAVPRDQAGAANNNWRGGRGIRPCDRRERYHDRLDTWDSTRGVS